MRSSYSDNTSAFQADARGLIPLLRSKFALLVQLVEASDLGSECWGFESLVAHQTRILSLAVERYVDIVEVVGSIPAGCTIRGCNMDIAIYSTYCGVTEKHSNLMGSFKYPKYFVSNNGEVLEQRRQDGWSPIYLPEPVVDDVSVSTRQAKIAKIRPEYFNELRKHDYILYVDDKVTLDESKIELAVKELEENNSALSLMLHPYLHGNVLFEYTESLFNRKYYEEQFKMAQFITEQTDLGKSLAGTNRATGILLRDNRHPDTENINKTWERLTAQCGLQCQISFFFTEKEFNSISSLRSDIVKSFNADYSFSPDHKYKAFW